MSAEDATTRLFWATAVAVAAAAIAPCLGLEPGAVGITGRGAAQSLVPLAGALGCPLVELRNPSRKDAPAATARLVEIRQACSWPLALTHSDRRPLGRAAGDLPAGVVCRVDDWTADVLALAGGWTIVDGGGQGATSMLPVMAHGHAFLPNYLRHFCTSRPHVGGGNLVDALLGDMADWFGDRGGNAHAVRRAATLVRVDDESMFAGRFADLVSRLFYEGDLATTRADMGEPAPHLPALAVLGGGLLHVPRAGVVRALARRDAPHLDVALATRRLAAAGVLVDERDHGGYPGWVVPESWWADHHQRWRARNRTSLRKVD